MDGKPKDLHLRQNLVGVYYELSQTKASMRSSESLARVLSSRGKRVERGRLSRNGSRVFLPRFLLSCFCFVARSLSSYASFCAGGYTASSRSSTSCEGRLRGRVSCSTSLSYRRRLTSHAHRYTQYGPPAPVGGRTFHPREFLHRLETSAPNLSLSVST